MFDRTPERLVPWMLVMIVLAATVTGVPGAGATVIFDNFDVGGGFSPTDNSPAASADHEVSSVTSSRSAGQFTVTGGDIALDSITLPISIESTTLGNFLRVRLTADAGGAPGTTLEVLSENQGIWPTTTNPFTTRTTLSSAIHPLLSNGASYWIVTELTSFPCGDPVFVQYTWFLNTSGTKVPYRHQLQLGSALTADPWTGFSGTVAVAFRVDGTRGPINHTSNISGNGPWAVVATMATASSAGATVIVDNFDAGGGFNPTNSGVAARALITTALRAAVQFTVTGGDISLDSVTLPIGIQSSTPGNFLRVRLTADGGGAPGTTLEVLSENQGIWPTTTNPFTTKTTLSSAAHPLLSNGASYWLVTDLTSFPCGDPVLLQYRWFNNTSGTTVPSREQEQSGRALPFDPWTGFSGPRALAFRADGTRASTGVEPMAPGVTALAPARPTPFRVSTVLEYSLARGGAVELAIYSVNGQRIRTLERGERGVGVHRVSWDGRDNGGQQVPAGVYFARLVTAEGRAHRIVIRVG